MQRLECEETTSRFFASLAPKAWHLASRVLSDDALARASSDSHTSRNPNATINILHNKIAYTLPRPLQAISCRQHVERSARVQE